MCVVVAVCEVYELIVQPFVPVKVGEDVVENVPIKKPGALSVKV